MARECPSCGKEIGDEAGFCSACGMAIEKDAARGAAGQSAGLQSNLAAALCYLWITAIIFLLLEPYNRDKFVRFHAFQALFLGLASIAGQVILSVIPVLGWMLLPVWSLLVLVLAIIGAVKAYNNETWNIPAIGPFAAKQV